MTIHSSDEANPADSQEPGENCLSPDFRGLQPLLGLFCEMHGEGMQMHFS